MKSVPPAPSVKKACRKLAQLWCPSEMTYFEATWSAVMGSLGLKDFSKATDAHLQAIRERLSSCSMNTALRSALDTRLDYSILVVMASVLEIRALQGGPSITLESIFRQVQAVIERSDVPSDVAPLLSQRVPPLIAEICGVELPEGSQRALVPPETAEGDSRTVGTQRRASTRGGRLKGRLGAVESGLQTGGSLYTLVLEGGDYRGKVVIVDSGKRKLEMYDWRYRNFLAALAVRTSECPQLTYEDTCRYLLHPEAFKEREREIQARQALSDEQERRYPEDDEREARRFWAATAYSPVRRFREHLEFLGINPDHVLGNVRRVGYRLMCRARRKGRSCKRSPDDPNKVVPTRMCLTRDAEHSQPRIHDDASDGDYDQ